MALGRVEDHDDHPRNDVEADHQADVWKHWSPLSNSSHCSWTSAKPGGTERQAILSGLSAPALSFIEYLADLLCKQVERPVVDERFWNYLVGYEALFETSYYLGVQRPIAGACRLLELRLQRSRQAEIGLDVFASHALIIGSKVLAFNVAVCYIWIVATVWEWLQVGQERKHMTCGANLIRG